MSDMFEQELAGRLRALTTWEGPKPQVWRAALKRTGREMARGRGGRRYALWFWLSGAAAVAAVIFAIALPSQQAARSQAKRVKLPFEGLASPDDTPRELEAGVPALSSLHRNVSNEWLPHSLYGPIAGQGQQAPGQSENAVAALAGQLRGERHVIRKATMELVATDVHTAYLKARLLISEAQGEYVQESTVRGAGDALYASLTLRVAAARLSEVLNALHELGELKSENATGEDVTAQIVDLEARLRNERQVETELRELLTKREDAPLKEILELRRALGGVREEIERMVAQREHLGRLVSLATVLVIIRPPDATVIEPPAGIGAYWRDSLTDAWTGGLHFLVRTISSFVAVLVGGLVWWVLLLVVVLIVRGVLRRRTVGGV